MLYAHVSIAGCRVQTANTKATNDGKVIKIAHVTPRAPHPTPARLLLYLVQDRSSIQSLLTSHDVKSTYSILLSMYILYYGTQSNPGPTQSLQKVWSRRGSRGEAERWNQVFSVCHKGHIVHMCEKEVDQSCCHPTLDMMKVLI